jgi:hypothetical protein
VKSVPDALRAIFDHVNRYADSTAWDTAEQPSAEREAARREAILKINKELETLIEESETRKISVREFEAIREKLSEAQFVAFVPDDLIAVHEAFQRQ